MDKGWTFPDLNEIIEPTSFDQVVATHPDLDESDKRLLELEKLVQDKSNEIQALQQHLNEIKSLKSEEEQRLIQLTHAIHSMIPTLNAEITSLVSDMVKKIAHKVIQQEIANDHVIMKKLIEDFIEELGKSELIQIEVSQSDYEKLGQLPFDTKGKWRVNNQLNTGDVIVTNEIAGIRLKVEEAIKRLLSDTHE